MRAVHINHTFFCNFICTHPSGDCCFLLHRKHLGLECGSGNESCCFKAGTNETHGPAMTKGGCLMRKYLVQSVLCVWFSMCVHVCAIVCAIMTEGKTAGEKIKIDP